jgi:hypothetical protein
LTNLICGHAAHRIKSTRFLQHFLRAFPSNALIVRYALTKIKRSTFKSKLFQSKSKMVWKLFQAPMASQYKCCDESSVTEDNGSSFSELSVDSNNLNAQPDPFSEEATFPSQDMMQQPVPPAHATGIQEAPSTPDTSDESKIAKGGITPRTRPPLRTNLSRRRIRTHAPLRVHVSVAATTLGEPHQKQVLPSKAPKALPMPQDSQQVPTRRDHIRKLSPPRTKERRDESPVKSEQAKETKEATVGLRRRQCTRPVLNSRSYTLQSRSAKTLTPTQEQISEHKKLSRQDARFLTRTKSEPLVRTVKSASAA